MDTIERDEKLVFKQGCNALVSQVIRDAKLECVVHGRDLKIRYNYINEETKSPDFYFVQFPKAIRRAWAHYIADIYIVKDRKGQPFARAYKGTIRDLGGRILG